MSASTTKASDQTVDFFERVATAPPRPEAVARRVERRLEDRFDHQLQRRLRDAVFNHRDTQRPRPAIAFRDLHPSDRLRPVTARPQRRCELGQIDVRPRREPFEALPIHARRALVWIQAAISVAGAQNVPPSLTSVHGVDAELLDRLDIPSARRKKPRFAFRRTGPSFPMAGPPKFATDEQARRNIAAKRVGAVRSCLIDVWRRATPSSHYWARELAALGHEVRLVPPSYVKGYVKRGKSDVDAAEAICEAVTRPSMRFVPTKSTAQQATMVSHRLHDMLMRQRTMLINLLRSQMAEFGLVAPKGGHGVATLVAIFNDATDTRVPAPARAMLEELVATLEALKARLKNTEKAIVASVRNDPVAQRLMTIPGVGPITASAMVAMVGDPGRFRNGRHFADWLGLVPKQNGTGGKMRPRFV